MGFFNRFGIPSVPAAEAREQVRSGAQLLDVRETNEWNAGHAPQALHAPLTDLDTKIGRLRTDRPVIVVCRSGNRSRSATSKLIGLGYEAHNLTGGMRAWEAAGGAVLDRKGRPGRII